MLTDFYASFAATCFVVLSLWLVVVQMRYEEWTGTGDWTGKGDDEDSTWRAYGVGLYFSLPGIMTLISLVDPTSPVLWRTSYAIVALGGIGALIWVDRASHDQVLAIARRRQDPAIARRRQDPAIARHNWLLAITYGTAIVLYGAVAMIAIFANVLDITKLANRVDAVLLCVVVFLGVNLAWLLLFRPSKAHTRPAAVERQPT